MNSDSPLPQSVRPTSPAFQTAARDCESLVSSPAPNAAHTGRLRACTLRVAARMRSHGVPDFLDGPITTSSAIAPNSPASARAMQACRKYVPGGSSNSAF